MLSRNAHSGGSRLGTPLNNGVPNPASSRNPLSYEGFCAREGEEQGKGKPEHRRGREKDKDTDRQTRRIRRRDVTANLYERCRVSVSRAHAIARNGRAMLLPGCHKGRLPAAMGRREAVYSQT